MSKQKKDLPPDWKEQNAAEVLGPVHFAKFVEIWDRLDGDMMAVQGELRTYLAPFKAEFDAKGFDTVFLSYVIPFHAANAKGFDTVFLSYVIPFHAAQLQAQVQAQQSASLTDDIMRLPRQNRSWN